MLVFGLAFDFCRFCVVIRCFHPRHSGQWPPTSKDFYTRSYPLHYFLILIFEKEPVFPFSRCWVLNKWTAGNIFYNVFGVTRSLTGDWTRDLPHSKPVLIKDRHIKVSLCYWNSITCMYWMTETFIHPTCILCMLVFLLC